jgi:hypothetical protein
MPFDRPYSGGIDPDVNAMWASLVKAETIHQTLKDKRAREEEQRAKAQKAGKTLEGLEKKVKKTKAQLEKAKAPKRLPEIFLDWM